MQCIIYLWMLLRHFCFGFQQKLWYIGKLFSLTQPHWPCWICIFISFNKIMKVTVIIPSNIFSHQPNSLLWDSVNMNVRLYDIVPHVSEALFIFFQIFFSLCCSEWIVSIALYFKLIYFSLVSSILPLSINTWSIFY